MGRRRPTRGGKNGGKAKHGYTHPPCIILEIWWIARKHPGASATLYTLSLNGSQGCLPNVASPLINRAIPQGVPNPTVYRGCADYGVGAFPAFLIYIYFLPATVRDSKPGFPAMRTHPKPTAGPPRMVTVPVTVVVRFWSRSLNCLTSTLSHSEQVKTLIRTVVSDNPYQPVSLGRYFTGSLARARVGGSNPTFFPTRYCVFWAAAVF